MFGKRHRDYKKVFNMSKEILDGQLKVKEVILDFEASVLSAIPEVFPDVVMPFTVERQFGRKCKNLTFSLPTQMTIKPTNL